MHTGPNIERNGLVFGYDTGYGVADSNTATRFYKGASITNTSNTTAIGPSWNNSGTAAWSSNDTEVPRLFSDVPVFSMEKLTNGNSHIGLGSTPATVSTVYTYSIYIWIKPGNSTGMSGSSPYFRPQPANSYLGPLTYNGSSSWSTWPRGRWIRISITATTPSNVTSAYISCYLDTAGDKVYFTAPQFTSTNFLSPFVNGTRFTNLSLIDLTKTSNIIVSNVSFDSTGQPIFDGTDDYMQISLTGINLDSSCTIEGVLKRNSTPTAWRTFFNIKPSSATTPFFEFRSNANSQYIYVNYFSGTDYATNAASFPTGNYGHAVATYDGNGNLKMYFNGELIHTKTGVPSFALGTSPRLTIGRAYSNDRYTDIEAPVVKVYNRALSADEVQQNYRAYKNRFDI
jgi:hypothetical protein